MARIAHLSDLHFGAHDADIVSATEAWLQERRPDLIIISGDFTQRARVSQFMQAGAYLDRLRAAGLAVLTIPGNHDIPLYDVFRRFSAPLRRYRRHISNDLCPYFENDEVAVLGINTARSLTLKDGRINERQMRLIRERLADVAAGKTRVLVTHHPLLSVPIRGKGEWSEAVGRSRDAVEVVSAAGVHIALAGHFHQTYAEAARKMVKDAGSTLIVQAGTATSTRLRNAEPQSFNWLHIRKNDAIELQVVVWDGGEFRRFSHVDYSFDGENWACRDIIDQPDACQTASER